MPGASVTVETDLIKRFAARELMGCPFLRQLILQEPDRLDAHEFVTKCGVWLRLLREERARALG